MILEILGKEEWTNILHEIGQYDCYHTFEYHAISKQMDEIPKLLVYRSNKTLIALPILMRPIPNTEFFDCTSVYGYPGPIFNKATYEEDFIVFQQCLESYFLSKKVISVFSRLNPFIENQENALQTLGYIEELGDVVNIDLTKDIDLQRQLFSKTTKRYLNKSRRICYTKKSQLEEDILTFIDLYYENMDRVNAKKSYYFDREYFIRMLESKEFKAEVIYAVLQETDEIISAAMMMKTNDIVQYHISGTKNDYLHLTPIRLLLDEIRIDGTHEGYKYFNLGGGLGSEEDSLFQFKASFSKDFKTFKVWKYVVNPSIYNKLAKQNSVESDDVSFFPKYRLQSR